MMCHSHRYAFPSRQRDGQTSVQVTQRQVAGEQRRGIRAHSQPTIPYLVSVSQPNSLVKSGPGRAQWKVKL